MALVITALTVFLVLCTDASTAQKTPPFVDGSYGAVGEMVIQYSDTSVISVAFEENFDFDSRKSVFTVWLAGLTTTLYEDMNLNQTMKYDEGLDGDQIINTCEIYSPSEWISVHTPPDLEIIEIKETAMLFPLMQLLWGLQDRLLKKGVEVEGTSYRDVPCDKWTYQMNYTSKDKTVDYVIEVEAYWSNGEWNTSAKENVVPVGFVIHHKGVNKTSGEPTSIDQYVNIMHFTRDYFKKDAFLPKQGIFCPGRKGLKPFPKFQDFKGLSVGVEFDWQNYKLDSNVDMKLDGTNKVIQIEFDPIDQPYDPLNPKKKTSYILIASYEEHVAYQRTEKSCKVIPIKEVNYDVQTIYDIRELSHININYLFGHNVKYVYVGETTKRGIPCHMWQGQRRGWPGPSAPGITTVWEWCIAERVGNPVIFEDGALPIVSLDITVTESTLTTNAGKFTLGTKLSYNFYEVITKTPSYLNSFEFDISPCFDNEYKEWLQFKVRVTQNQTLILKNATVDVNFIDKWRTEIYGLSGIRPSSLRVARVRTILSNSVLLVQFILLDRHPDMPKFVETINDLKTAKKKLKSAIDTNSMEVFWQGNLLKAASGTLETAFEIKEPITETTTTTPSTTTTSTTSSTTKINTLPPVTPPSSTPTPTIKEEETTTQETIPTEPGSTTDGVPEQHKSPENRHSSGAMAGLGIGMLLLGFSIGAGGTFAKFRYLPRV